MSHYQDFGRETVAFHFIPLNPGPDHQVGLLRNLMARLILKYHLSGLYVASENRATVQHGISIGTNTENTDGVMGDHFIVANNISIDNALLGIRERMGVVGSHNQYLYNIVYGNGDSPFGDEHYNWPSAAGNKDSNTITQNAQFVHYAVDGSGDYHLQATSPAIGAGTSADAPSTDFDGKPRPQGKSVDIGPYQYA